MVAQQFSTAHVLVSPMQLGIVTSCYSEWIGKSPGIVGISCEHSLQPMAMTQEPIDWRYRFHIFLAYFSGLNFREYPHNSYGQTYGTVQHGTNIPPLNRIQFHSH